MPAVCITPPTTEPLSLAEGRYHLRETVVDTNMDDEIKLSIQATRELCENTCRRALITQQWKVVSDNFSRPDVGSYSGTSWWYGPAWDIGPSPMQSVRWNGTTGYEIYLPFPPLQSVDAVSYIDDSGVQRTLDVASQLIVDSYTQPSRIMPAFNTSWPATQKQANALSITFTCGYGDNASDVPACARQWMKAMLGAVHELRQAEFSAYRETLIAPAHIDRLLDPIRIVQF